MKFYFLGLIAFIISNERSNYELDFKEKDRSICWIQNAGFFIDLPGGDILIDAILSSNDALANAEPPYHNVRLIFVSHIHGDHFNARGIIRHLESNEKAHVILTPESFDALRQQGLDETFASRVLTSFPNEDELEAFNINGFSGNILQFKHAGVQNIGFGLHGDEIDLVYLNGGIQNEELVEEFSANHSDTDLLIANKWPLNNTDYISNVEEMFKPNLLLMAHHSGGSDGIVINNGGVASMEEKMSIRSMKGIVFEKRMQCENF